MPIHEINLGVRRFDSRFQNEQALIDFVRGQLEDMPVQVDHYVKIRINGFASRADKDSVLAWVMSVRDRVGRIPFPQLHLERRTYRVRPGSPLRITGILIYKVISLGILICIGCQPTTRGIASPYNS